MSKQQEFEASLETCLKKPINCDKYLKVISKEKLLNIILENNKKRNKLYEKIIRYRIKEL